MNWGYRSFPLDIDREEDLDIQVPTRSDETLVLIGFLAIAVAVLVSELFKRGLFHA